MISKRIRRFTRNTVAAVAVGLVAIAYAMVAMQASGVQNTMLSLRISATGEKVQGANTAKFPVTLDYSQLLASGTGANQASNVFYDVRTITASSSENLDLAGTLTNAFGVTLTFTKIKAVIIHASSANTNNVQVGGAASNGWVAWVADATDIVSVKPGGTLIWIAPDASGGAVVAATGDILKVANSSSGTSVIYDVTIIGVD